MNYQKIYDQIIERAKTRQLEGYKEKHHIIPRCIGGGNKKSNIVELTAREHFLCHWLLHEIYPTNSKLAFSFWAMCNQKNQFQNRYIPSSKIYLYAKEVYSKNQSIFAKSTFSGKGNPMFGKKHSDKTKQLLREKKLGKKGYVHRDDSIKKMSVLKIDLLNPMSRKICQYSLDNIFIREWNCISTAAMTLNISRNGINRCCTGQYKTSGGYLWKYL